MINISMIILRESIRLILEVLNKKQLIAKYPDRADEIEELSKLIEPKYLQWVVDLRSKESSQMFHNHIPPSFDAVTNLLKDFEVAKKSGNKYVRADIYSYKPDIDGWNELVKQLESWRRAKQSTRGEKKRRSGASTSQALAVFDKKTSIADGDNWSLYRMKDSQEACQLGSGTN